MPLITFEDNEKIINEFNNTKTCYPDNQTVHQLFEEVVKIYSQDIAVVYKDRQVSYGELNNRANKLATILRSKGIKADSLVGLIVDKSPEMIIGMLAILKAGGSYVPILPEYPIKRIEEILEDSKISLVLSNQLSINSENFLKREFIDLSLVDNYLESTSNVESISQSTDLAYVMYTSGSTGKPKGVMVEHKSIIRLVFNTNYLDFSSRHKILQTGAITFDASTFEIWGALLHGGTLYLIDQDELLNIQKLKERIYQYKITTLWLTSPFFSQISNNDISVFKDLTNLIVGGDTLNIKHVNFIRLNFPNLKIINGYGPTENTTFSTYFLVDKLVNDNVPIGKPISNSTVYILDSTNSLQPIGIPGELCVGGDGLARGYLNNPELTKEKFIENPFKPGERLYKTGDLARWLPNGNVEFLGRLDHQVKVRGFRIEVGEVEAHIRKHLDVKECIVVPKQDTQDQTYLCAYIVANEMEITLKDLRSSLGQSLPEYMIPSAVVQLDVLPLTPNGKIDRKALPEPNYEREGSTYVAPRNDLEKKMVDIWEDILGVTPVGVHDNFFELGGHSLKATVLIGRLNKEFDIEVPLREIFRQQTLEEMVHYITHADKQ
uniref:non-ribosomal peptide synthetase n=1 Tax=Priestia aryabhattai TaxID=412384 RepID=UPI001CFEC24D